MKYFTLIWCLVLFSFNTNAQVTEIWTNYGGFWNSSASSQNSILPDNSHELLAFRSDGINLFNRS